MIEYVVTSSIWSAAGFLAGWFACSRYTRLESKIEHLEESMEGKSDDSSA